MEKLVKKPNIIIFGAGISGATIANLLANDNFSVTVYEKNNFIGGNCYDYMHEGILVHKFGPHIFHTSNEQVYKFINKFTKLNSYKHIVDCYTKNLTFPLPINFHSIEIIMGIEAKETINILAQKFSGIKETIVLSELKSINHPLTNKLYKFLYDNVFANYTSKMWGTEIKNVDPNTINRIKIILSYNDTYFPDDKYQGLPKNGYTAMITKMLTHKNINVITSSKKEIKILANSVLIDNDVVSENDIIIYCGSIDKLFDCSHGYLPYRSLKIDFEYLHQSSFLTKAVNNFPSDPIMTRITEYKLMTLQKSKFTCISKEYPGSYDPKSKNYSTPFYPISNEANNKIYNVYFNYINNNIHNFYLLGRLAQYKYYDMDDAIAASFELYDKIKNKLKNNS